MAELDREEYNNDHAETRRHVSLDDGEDGEWLSTGEYAADNTVDPSTASKRNSAVIEKFKKIFE